MWISSFLQFFFYFRSLWLFVARLFISVVFVHVCVVWCACVCVVCRWWACAWLLILIDLTTLVYYFFVLFTTQVNNRDQSENRPSPLRARQPACGAPHAVH